MHSLWNILLSFLKWKVRRSVPVPIPWDFQEYTFLFPFLQGELCPWLPACRWGRRILSGATCHMSHILPHVTYHMSCHGSILSLESRIGKPRSSKVFPLQEKVVALPPRTGGGLISSGTIRLANNLSWDHVWDSFWAETKSEIVFELRPSLRYFRNDLLGSDNQSMFHLFPLKSFQQGFR